MTEKADHLDVPICSCIYPLEEVSALKNRSTGEVVTETVTENE